jgi:two-component system, LytTR family, response regulator
VIRVLIVDDEPLARRSIRRLLDKASGVEIVGECGDGESAAVAIRAGTPDLVFLDVQMPEMTGFDVVRSIGPDLMPATIFVTAYDRYALRAFDANGVDYLLKPFSRERFEAALGRARERIAGKLSLKSLDGVLRRLGDRNGAPVYAERLPVAENGRILLIGVNDIDWIDCSGNYLRVHAGRRDFQIRQTLKNLRAKLDPAQFLRIHRSTIVNIRRIREIQPWFHGHHLIILQGGQQLRMSRYQRAAARQLGIR